MTRGPAPNPHRDEILRMRSSGVGQSDIARALGISKDAVIGIVRREKMKDIEYEPLETPQPQVGRILRVLSKMEANGLTVTAVSVRSGVSESIFRRWRAGRYRSHPHNIEYIETAIAQLIERRK